MSLAEAILPQPVTQSGLSRAYNGEERLARLRLSRSENVGPRTFTHLLRRFGSAAEALEALPVLARRGGRSNYLACPLETAEAEMEAGEAAGACLLTIGDALYPPLLAAIDSAPPVIWVVGRIGVLARPAVGVVGARNASALGLRTARRIATGLGDRGYVIVSGLARGIDRAAHEATLDTGTIAVMAGGVDRIFPPENEDLARRITETGVLVSECAFGTEPTARHFPRRNRLISGLSQGVVLIEAAVRSGSLITARYALDQGREVMACPGAAEDPRAGGCNHMIRDGAALIRTADDVVEALAEPRAMPAGLAEPGAEFLFDADVFDDLSDDTDLSDLADFEPEGDAGGDALAEQVLRLLGPNPIEIDEIRRLCGATPAETSLAVLELDLAGRIDLLPGGLIAHGGMVD